MIERGSTPRYHLKGEIKMKSETLVGIIVITSIIVVGSILLVNMIKNEEEQMTVSATGFSEIDLEPDYAEVGFYIVTRHNTSAELSAEENTQISNLVIDELRFAGLSMNDIETVSYHNSDEYDWEDGKRIFKCYKTTHTIKATIDDIDDVGLYIEIAVSNGALVNYCNYGITTQNLNNAKITALEEASADARKKAQAILMGVGKELGELISISTDYGYYPYRAYDMAVSDIDEKGYEIPVILPENVDVSATVYVSYNIK